MTISYIAIFFASFVGSAHCAGMCGGFAGFCANTGGRPSTALLLYHLGRLVSYAVLGAIAGVIGQSINSTGLILGIQHAASVLTGILLILWGVGSFFNSAALSVLSSGKAFPFRYLSTPLQWIHAPGRPYVKTGLLGLISGLLPCGWLYMFVAVAASTAHPLQGALVMTFFWAGTVPILSAVGGASRIAFARLKPYAPRIVGCLLIFAGIYSLSTHVLPGDHEHHHSNHAHH